MNIENTEFRRANKAEPLSRILHEKHVIQISVHRLNVSNCVIKYYVRYALHVCLKPLDKLG